MSSRRVAVTGGAGFIGSHLVDGLVARGHQVRVIDNFATGRRDFLNPAAELHEIDIRDPRQVGPALAGVECVFHAAALPRVPLSIAQPLETHLTNVDGTLNLLIGARDNQVRRFIFSSSSSVYGDQPVLPLVESMSPNPGSPYALQKQIGEQYARMFHRLFALETFSLRYFAVYGPRMPTEGAYMLAIAAFLRARRESRPLTIFGDGEQTRDFTHVSDVVEANLLAMDAPGADGRVLNIGRGDATSINKIAAAFGGTIEYKAPRPGDVRHTLADNREARRVLWWNPKVSIQEGLAALLAN